MLAIAPSRTLSAERAMMGGRVSVHLRDVPAGDVADDPATRILDRIARWARRLTRFEPASELMRLNESGGAAMRVGPTLTAVLDWARELEGSTDGRIDVAMLDARLAVEAGDPIEPPPDAARRWSLRRLPRGAIVERSPGVRFDLDGIAKGWLADRALAIAPGRSALIDADGDISVRIGGDDSWMVGVADPIDPPDGLLAVLRLASRGPRRTFGVATSGTSVHRWIQASGPAAHHVIDPATWRSATTDVIQATVVADSARLAEGFAKAAVIAGATDAFEIANRPGVHGLLVVTADGELRASEGMARWLA